MSILVFSGHMVDAINREKPRFPAANVPAVEMAINSRLQAWQVNRADQAFCSAACGSDLLFAESCLKRGLKPTVCLPFPRSEFLKRSVSWAGFVWETRFNKVCDQANVLLFTDQDLGEEENIYARTNRWMQDLAATALASNPQVGPIRVLLVWDEQRKEQNPGGTAHFAEIAEARAWPLTIITPQRAIAG